MGREAGGHEGSLPKNLPTGTQVTRHSSQPPQLRRLTSSSQVAFRLDFEFSKSVFLHHLEIRLTAGRSGPHLLLLPPAPPRCSWPPFGP